MSVVRSLTLTVRVIALLLVLAPAAGAQVDTTPPVLLEFDFAPRTINTSLSDQTVRLVGLVADDLSGPRTVHITIRSRTPGYHVSSGHAVMADGSFVVDRVISQFSVLGTYEVEIGVSDNTFNARFYTTNDLAALGFPSTFENTSTPGAGDADGDGVSDYADNCPDDVNPSQEDGDLDLIGDACDRFPENRDNEQAQCEADLAQCLSQPVPDADGDGEPNATDRCSATPSGQPIDDAGCSLAQFCGAIDVTLPAGIRLCRRADWGNDEPLMRAADRDCTLDRGGAGPEDDRCVPVLP